MKLKKSLLAPLLLVVSAILAFSCMLVSACKPAEEEKETYAITWNIPEKVTVTADGYTELPKTAQADTKISFTVASSDANYEIASVKSNNVSVKGTDGKYEITIKKDTTVAVTTEKKISEIVVTPAKELIYFAEESVNKEDIAVSVKYADGTSETITDYTVAPEKFSLGDTEFTVTYKGKTSAAVKLAKAAEERKFGFTGVKLEVGTDGKPYYVLTGTYANYDTDKFSSIGFDFQEQGFWSEANGGTAGWGYTKYNTEISDFADGVYTLRIDMTDLATKLADKGIESMLFNPHMGFATPGDNNNPNVEVEEGNYTEGESITVNGITYTIHKEAEGNNPTTTWNMVGVIVTNPSIAALPKFTDISLEVKNNKPYAVFNGTATVTTTEEDLQQQILEKINHLDLEDISNGNASLGVFVDGSVIADESKAFFEFDTTAKTFKLYVLLEGDAVQDGANFFAHLGTLGSDGYYPNVSLPGNTEANSITCNGFVFSFTDAATIFGDPDTVQPWQSGLLYINVKTAA